MVGATKNETKENEDGTEGESDDAEKAEGEDDDKQATKSRATHYPRI